MAVIGDGSWTIETSSGSGVSSISDSWELPPSNVFGKVVLGGVFGWETGPLAATIAVLGAKTQQADGSVTSIGLSSDTDAVGSTSPHMFGDPNMIEITFGLSVRNGIGWAQELLTFFD